MLKSRLAYSIIFFLMCVALFWVTKPSFAFDERGRPRPFGFGEDRTLFTVGVVTVAASILTFYVFTLIDVIYGSSAAALPAQARPSQAVLPPQASRYLPPQQVLRTPVWGTAPPSQYSYQYQNMPYML